MENLQEHVVEASSLKPEHNPVQTTQKVYTRGHMIGVLCLALLLGLVGGLVSPYVKNYYLAYIPLKAPEAKKTESEQMIQKNIVAEDDLLTSLVEKNSSGVVSIVISKDVPMVRSYYSDPFSGFPFFSPFGTPERTPQYGSGETEKQKIGSGSGFFVSSDGLIITNKHVVTDDQAEYTVIANGGKEYPAKILARDPTNDIAIIKIEGNDFPALTLGDSDQLKVGQTVVAIGNPLGEFADSVTRGIVSGLRRNVSAGSSRGMQEQLTNIIQTDAAINPGNSGGPLFNIFGEVVGMNVAMAQGAENIGFALPINSVKRVVEQVRTTGKISVPYIGVRYVMLDETIQKDNNLPYRYGALVLRGQNMTDFAVIPGSPADKAGIVENDIILEINGKKVDNEHPLASTLGEYNVGDEITLKIWHKGEENDVKVKLEERK